jgi:hypothetical protein
LLGELLNRSALPIINENDSISLEELTFGDNDMLSLQEENNIFLHPDFSEDFCHITRSHP